MTAYKALTAAAAAWRARHAQRVTERRDRGLRTAPWRLIEDGLTIGQATPSETGELTFLIGAGPHHLMVIAPCGCHWPMRPIVTGIIASITFSIPPAGDHSRIHATIESVGTVSS